MLIAFIPITWFKKLWILSSPINEDEPNRITPPQTAFNNYLFNTSRSIMSNGVARIAIYIVSICMLTMSALVHLVCNRLDDLYFVRFISINFFLFVVFVAASDQVECEELEESEDETFWTQSMYSPCMNPWVMAN